MVDPVRPLVAIAGLQAVLGILGLVAEIVAVLSGTRGLAGDAAGRAVFEVLLWLLAVGALGLIWLGLYRRRAVARTPFLLVQLFVLVAAVPLLWPSDILGFRVLAGVLGVVAVLGIVLGLRGSVRVALH